MKFNVRVMAPVVWLAAALALPAKNPPARPFFMPQPVALEGTDVPQGMYQLKIEENKADVQVELWKDARFVASWHGAWVKSGVKYKENAVLLRVNPDGTRSLVEIRLAGASKTIMLRDPGGSVSVGAK